MGRRPDEAGSGTLLTIGGVVVVLAVTVMVLLAVGANLAVHRARTAADLAALSAAAEYEAGGAPCGAAARAAGANGATIADCALAGDAFDFVASVTVSLPVFGVSWVPGQVRATAYAGRLSG
jgi:secretion/DNA translocation related TadE-like protein